VTDARAEILRRVRSALVDVPSGERPGDVPVARDYARTGQLGREEVLARFAERLEDYGAAVQRVAGSSVAGAVDDACERLALRRVAVPPGLPAEWRPTGVEIVEDHASLTPRELDAVAGALTGCAVAIAETGTLVLDGEEASGRRVLTLVPDNYVCVVEADQVVETVPEALSRVAPAVRDRRMPITLVSGPSASSDIELTRVEGVHGPRNLVVLIVG
jgi:L-lactate dehydrogenase complex protein LldG